MPDDLVTRCVDDRGLALANRNEGVPSVTDPEEHVADVSRPLLAVQRERGRAELRSGPVSWGFVIRQSLARAISVPDELTSPVRQGRTGLVYYLRCEARELAEGGKA